jgi:hypothetical protein
MVPKPLTSISSIIAGNDNGAAIWRDAYAVFNTASNSLLGDGTGATGFVAGVAGNLVGLDPQLGLLQDNGGPTPTMALLPGSPAIDTGSNPLGLGADQRGFVTRTVGGIADMGAYESGATAPPRGSGGTPSLVPIIVKVVKVKGRWQIRVYDAATSTLKFAVYPFGKGYHGKFQFKTADVNGDGTADVIASRRLNRKRSMIKIFSGLDGAPLTSSLA